MSRGGELTVAPRVVMAALRSDARAEGSAVKLPQQGRSQVKLGNEGGEARREIGNGVASAIAFPNRVWERGWRGSQAIIVGAFLILAFLAVGHAQTTNAGPVIQPPPDKAPVAPTNPQFQYNLSPPAPGVEPGTAPVQQQPSLTPTLNPPPPAALTSPVVNPSSAPPAPNSGSAGEDIYDIRPPVFFLHGWLWLWLLLAALALVALVIFIWRWFASRSVFNPLNAYELALKKIEAARPLMDVNDPVPYAVAVSEAIRTYLSQRFLNPSDRRTTEEFLRQMEMESGTPLAQHRDLLREFLQACDLLKFAKYRPSMDELEQAQRRAITFVTATQPVPTASPTAPKQLVPRPT